MGKKYLNSHHIQPQRQKRKITNTIRQKKKTTSTIRRWTITKEVMEEGEEGLQITCKETISLCQCLTRGMTIRNNALLSRRSLPMLDTRSTYTQHNNSHTCYFPSFCFYKFFSHISTPKSMIVIQCFTVLPLYNNCDVIELWYVCLCVCIYVCMYACPDACIYVYVYVRICIYICMCES